MSNPVVDSDFHKQEIKKYEQLCTELAKELKKYRTADFKNRDYIIELEHNYKTACKKLNEFKVPNVINSSNSSFIKSMRDYLIKDVGLSDADIQKIKLENRKRLQELVYI
jgi:hypothetical protein